MHNTAENTKVVQMKVGTGGVANGDLVTFTAGTVVKCGSGAAATNIVGIARETKVATEIALVEVIEGMQIVEANYTGSTKTSVADSDLGKVFGVTGPKLVNLDDTTNAVAVCVGYNNTVETIQFLVPAAKRYL